jgi:phage major head subunit gpT-like protein
MISTNTILNGLRTALRDEFRTRMAEIDAKPVWRLLSTVIPSSTKSNTYGWLGAFPQMREWVGDRVIKDIAESAYQIFNQKWESTLGVDRTDIKDDNLGQYRVLARSMADEFERFMSRKLAELITGGFVNRCYDDHPGYIDLPFGGRFPVVVGDTYEVWTSRGCARLRSPLPAPLNTSVQTP